MGTQRGYQLGQVTQWGRLGSPVQLGAPPATQGGFSPRLRSLWGGGAHSGMGSHKLAGGSPIRSRARGGERGGGVGEPRPRPSLQTPPPPLLAPSVLGAAGSLQGQTDPSCDLWLSPGGLPVPEMASVSCPPPSTFLLSGVPGWSAVLRQSPAPRHTRDCHLAGEMARDTSLWEANGDECETEEGWQEGSLRASPASPVTCGWRRADCGVRLTPGGGSREHRRASALLAAARTRVFRLRKSAEA